MACRRFSIASSRPGGVIWRVFGASSLHDRYCLGGRILKLLQTVNRDYFGQVLEGDRASVSDLFCRIAKDPRHRSVVIVEASAVAERRFDRWAMGLAEKMRLPRS